MTRMRWGLAAAGALAAVALLAAACGGNGEDGDDACDGETVCVGGDQTVINNDRLDELEGLESSRAGNTLQSVIDRDELKCGVTDSLPGFGFKDPDSVYSGFDIEFCRAIAAAVLGDAEKVQYVPTSAQARFELLATGEVDVLVRVTTITAQRDVGRKVDFAQTTFYDGQGFAVHADSGIRTADDMAGTTICVAAGTTTEQNLDDFFNERGLSYTPLPGEWPDPQDQFVARRCDVLTSDKSGLAARIAALPNPEDYRILPLTISREPLAPGVRDGDTEWKDVVNWVIYGLINAELLGVSRDNVGAMAADPPNTAIARLLGVPFGDAGVTDLGFGVDAQFIQRALMAVGNYGDIYARTIEPLGITRAGTLNALYTEGGILYAPPYR